MNIWRTIKRTFGLEAAVQINVNGCFSEAWEDTDPFPGFVINQVPNRWGLDFVDPGGKLYDSEDTAVGYPEAVHKLNSQLPQRERLGGDDALILCHDEANADHEPAVYKIFNSGAAFGATMWQVVTDLEPGSEVKISVPIRVHRHPGNDYNPDADAYATEFRMVTNGQGGWWNSEKLPNRKWVTRTQNRTADENGILEIFLQVKSKYNVGVDFFFDNIVVEAFPKEVEPPDPPEPPLPPSDDHSHDYLEEDIQILYNAQDALYGLSTDLLERIEALESLHDEQPQPPPTSAPPHPPEGSLIIDVSYWNGILDWNLLKANGVKGAFLRSSNGTGGFVSTPNGVDGQFWRNVSECWRLGIPFGVYHFLNGSVGVPEQMEHWIAILSEMLDRGYYPSLGIAYDAEESSPTIEAAKMAMLPVNEVADFILEAAVPESDPNGLRAAAEYMVANNPTNVREGIYTRRTWWNAIVPATATWPRDLGLFSWAASWVSNQPLTEWPSSDRNITPPNGFAEVNYWQFSSQVGNLLGLSSANMDGNYVMGAQAPPPSPEKIDILSYMIGTDKRQYDLEYDFSGGGTQTVQVRHFPDGIFLYVKGGNGEYEKLSFDDEWIYRYEDTSESPERFYIQTNSAQDKLGQIGAPWAKRFMSIGETAVTAKYIQHYLKANCHEENGNHVTDTIRLNRVYTSYMFPSGRSLDDVIEMEWVEGGELYWFAKGYGLAGFKFSGGLSWFLDGPLNGRTDLPIIVPPCLR